MTIEQLKSNFETVCLEHKQIKAFDFGEDFLLATGKGSLYPLAFLEIPYSITYNLADDRFKTVQFALLVLTQPTLDDVTTDHQSISTCDTIADAIITRIQKEFPVLGFTLTSVNGISLRNYSDDNVSGVRLDVQGITFRQFCKSGYKDQFNIPA